MLMEHFLVYIDR